MRYPATCFLLLLIYICGFSQSSNYTGLAAFSKQHRDNYSFMVQPAVLANAKEPAAAMLAEQKYLMKELTLTSLIISIPVEKAGFGFIAGIQPGAFQKQELSLSYGRKLTDQVDLGARFCWDNFKVIGYPRINLYSAGLGMNITLTEYLSTGVFACTNFNPHPSATQTTTSFRIGLGYDLSSLVHISMQWIKENRFPASLVTGIHYQLSKAIWIRAGIDTGFYGWWFGLGFNIKLLRIDLLNNYHPHLGLSPAIAVHFPFKKSGRL